MKKTNFFIIILILMSQLSFGQNQRFKMEGVNPISIAVNKTFSESVEIFPFDKNGKPIYGLDASANIELNGDKALVRLLLIDNNFNEYLIYESYNLLLEDATSYSIENICEETSILDNVKPYALQIELKNAKMELLSLSYSTALEQGKNIAAIKKEKKKAQNEEKINKINKNLKKQRKSWVAGPTSVSELSWSDKKKLYGQGTFPAGFEYYVGGVISAGTESTSTEDGSLKSATTETSLMVSEWDWRDRHGKNWISPVTDQGSCGSCWAFATTGATEAMVNLSLNQQLNLDLSEQDLLSCADAGNCGGGYPTYAIDYIVNTGIVDEATFPYTATVQPCESKGTNPTELIRFSGKEPFGFGSENYLSYTEDNLRKMLIEMGPVRSGLSDWAHAMVLVGYKVVKEGDVFYYRDLELQRYWKTVEAGYPLIGKIVWVFKNSWGPYFGDEGYIYVETPLNNIRYTYALKTPVISLKSNYEVICEDNDGDGYFWWGLGEKPATCTGSDLPDGNDADPTLGPLDEYGNCTLLFALPALPVANFSADKTVVNEGETVSFTDLSNNNPVSWSWVFEGGNPTSSTLKNPSVTYNASNNYKVSLTVSNAAGSNTKIIDNFIQVEVPTPVYITPVANFSADKTVVNEGETLSFTDLSSNNPTSWSWVFEGGNPATSTAQNPSVSYSSSGSNKVTLTATNASGSDTKIVDNYIQVEVLAPVYITPVANFSADKTVITEGEAVSFADISTNDPVAWLWSFEGGSPSTSNEKNPKVTYSNSNNFKVSLTVSNAAGSHSKITDNYIQVEKVVASYCVSSGNATNEWISSVQMGANSNNSGSGGYEDFTSKTFAFEAGKTYDINLVPGFSGRSKFEYWSVWIDYNGDKDFSDFGEQVFTASKQRSTVSGSITIPGGITTDTRMRVAMGRTAPTDCGLIDFGEVEDYSIHISEPVPQPPIADFSTNNINVQVGESIQFTDLSLNEPTSWQWSFPGGNPETSTEQNPNVTYSSVGNFDVTLVVTKEGFETSQKIETQLISVTENTTGEYCEPVSINSSNDYIQNVTIGNILNSNTNGDNYSFSANTIPMTSGQNYSVSLMPHLTKTRCFWRVWIDFNGDLDFDDAGESVVVLNNIRGNVNSTIVIPQNVSGTTRMRVSMKVGKVPSPCEDGFNGEVEDYLVSFGPASSMLKSAFIDNLESEIPQIFNLYPNPVNDKLNIQLNSVESGDSYSIYNMNGKIMISNQITSPLTNIDFAQYSTGMYLIVVVNKDEVFKKKFVKR
ncbi:MAG: PKD domain-containing protein [Bacteroidetes bacterium]|nr:PKD domain-containing protein [Bacteroidota bacterium]